MDTTSNNFPFNRVVVVGCGGVGTHLEPLFRYLAYKRPGTEVVLVDGDFFEDKNRERQDYGLEGNKAEVKAYELTPLFPELQFSHVPEYVTKDNAAKIIPENSVVFCAVDNHPSRKLLSDRVSTLACGVLISGGNDYSDGNVQMHVRMDGQDLTPPITHMHPEIEFPQGKHPLELSCQDLAVAGSPQLVLANNMVATLMAGSFWRLERALEQAVANNVPLDFPEPESYFDLTTGVVRPVKRRIMKEQLHGAGTEIREVDVDQRGRSGSVEAASG